MTSDAAVKNFAKAISKIFETVDGDNPAEVAVMDRLVSEFREEANEEEREFLLEEISDLVETHAEALCIVGNFDTRQAQAVEFTMHSLARGILAVIDGDGSEDNQGYDLIQRHEAREPEPGNLSGSLAEKYYSNIQS